MATLRIIRSSEFVNRLRNIMLFLDDKEIGTIGNGKTMEFEIAPGNHVLQAKIDWCSSKRVSFSIGADENKAFVVGSFAKDDPMLAVATLFFITFGAGRYLVVEEVSGF